MPRFLPDITPRNTFVIGAVALGMAVAVGGIVHASTSYDLVHVDIDGVVTDVRTDGRTVDQVLTERGVELAATTKVSPALATDIDDGDVIKVRREKAVTLVVDGRISQQTVHDVDVRSALHTLGVQPRDGASLSMQLDERLGLEGNSLVVSNPKRLTLKVGGKKRAVTTSAPTMEALLTQERVTVGRLDEVKPSLGSYLKPRQALQVVRIKKVTRMERVPVDHEVTYTDDSSLFRGDTEVVKEGRPGLDRARVELVLADGEVRERRVISRNSVRPPIPEVVKRGTKDPNSVDGGVWDKIATCESGGNWSINTGNGYYGGLQFSLATWRSVGGPGYPHEQSKATQIKYAKILQARSGWGQWSCAAKVGVS